MYSSDLLSFSGRGYFFWGGGSGGCCRAGLVDILYCNEMPLLYVCMLPVITIILMLGFYTLADHTISLTRGKSPAVTRPPIAVDFSRLVHLVPVYPVPGLLLFTEITSVSP